MTKMRKRLRSHEISHNFFSLRRFVAFLRPYVTAPYGPSLRLWSYANCSQKEVTEIVDGYTTLDGDITTYAETEKRTKWMQPIKTKLFQGKKNRSIIRK